MEKEDHFNQSLIDYMFGFVTEERRIKMEEVLASRTRYLTVVLEDIYQPHNASAVIRSCDCFGIQDLHIIENKFKFSVSKKVVRGSSKWVDVYRYKEEKNNTLETLQKLKSEGYRIVATSPHAQGIELGQLDLERGKTALVFGTEKHGISSLVEQEADEFIAIPMYGFTESFNISVSVALCLQYLTDKLRKSDLDWMLDQESLERIKLDWVRKSVRRPETLEKEFLSRWQ